MLARKSLLLFTVNMANSFLGFLSTIVIARWMGPAVLGTIGYLLGLVGLLAVLLDMGFSFAHLKRVSESDQDPAPLVGTYLVLRGALAVVFLIAVMLLPAVRASLQRPLFQRRDEQLVYYIIAAFYILHGLSSVFLHTLEAHLQTAKESIATFGSSLLSFVAKAVVAIFGLGVVALGIAYLLEPLVLLGLAWLLFTGYRIARPTRQNLASYFRYTLPLTLTTVVNMVITNMNPVLIKTFWTTVEVGYYSSVLGFGAMLDHVALTVMTLFFPQASSDAAQGNWDEIRRRLFVIERYVLTILVPLGVVFIFFSGGIAVAALGVQFAPAARILMCLTANSVLSALFQPYRTVLYAIEKQRCLVLSSVLGLLTLVFVDIMLVPRQMGAFSLPGLSGTGAAIALVAMTIVSGIVQVRAVSRYARTGFYWKALWHLLAGGVMYGFLQAGSKVAPTSLWVRFPLLTLLGLGIYLVILALFRQFTLADAQVFWNVLHPYRMLKYIATELERRG